MPPPIVITIVFLAVLAFTAYVGYGRGCLRKSLDEEVHLSGRWFLSLFLLGAVLLCVFFWIVLVLFSANALFRMAALESRSIYADGGAEYFKLLGFLALAVLAWLSYRHCYQRGVARFDRHWRHHIKPMASR